MSSCDATCFPDASSDVECYCPLEAGRAEITVRANEQHWCRRQARSLRSRSFFGFVPPFTTNFARCLCGGSFGNVGRKAMSKIDRRSALESRWLRFRLPWSSQPPLKPQATRIRRLGQVSWCVNMKAKHHP